MLCAGNNGFDATDQHMEVVVKATHAVHDVALPMWCSRRESGTTEVPL